MSSAVNKSSWYGPPPPSELMDSESCDSSPRLISQGAEARVWLINLSASPTKKEESTASKLNVSVGSGINVPKLYHLAQIPAISLGTTSTICKERFPKKYRHPQLDISLTKSRTKAEARCLIKCQKAGVPCPNVLAIANWSNGNAEQNEKNTNTASSCLFLEHVDGCTVRHYFEEKSNPFSETSGQPKEKRARCETDMTDQSQDRLTTKIDACTMIVAYSLGKLVAKMHAAGVIHGDLTTSNVMLKNPVYQSIDGENIADWIPQLVLIDFGLATSTASVQQTSTTKKQVKQHKQQHNAEEKAVDLYVLERAFLSTHPESELLVEQVLKGYNVFYSDLDGCNGNEDGVKESSAVGQYCHVANSVMNRLEQVRMRGRKRECFG